MKTKAKEKKYKVKTYLVTCDINDKHGWCEEHVSHAFAQEAKERAAEEGCSSMEEWITDRMTPKEIESDLIQNYGKEKGGEEFLAWKRENRIP